MDCDRARQSLSAMIDQEDPGVSAEVVRRHVAGCAACQRWEADALALTRATRLRVAEEVPDLTDAIIAAVGAEAVARDQAVPRDVAPPEVPGVIRLTLGLIAIAEMLIALPALAGNDLGAPIHVAHEQAAWTVAMATALAIAAWRPSRAKALLPQLGAFVACLSALTVSDVLTGRVAPSAEIPHLMAGLGLALLWLESHPPVGLGSTCRPAPAPPGE
ncbi:MAG TPA: zf-HC2 domain-containing protein, partial [Acidimicrobiales bacterium]|nr:zf-HC2 domain-containing protein [Acidimicrobiales bacterium]